MIDVRLSAIHGQGGFASKAIPAGTRVVEYQGERIDKHESRRRCAQNNQFIFYLNQQFDIDGDVDWNPAKWLNHCCTPNCEAELIEGRIWIVAKRNIAAGEELTFNYGYDLENVHEYPCSCGSPSCLGVILAEEHHAQFRGFSYAT